MDSFRLLSSMVQHWLQRVYEVQQSVCEHCRSPHAGKQQVVYGHRDFEYMLPGNVRASFIWAPYAANLTTMYTNWYAHAMQTHPPSIASWQSLLPRALYPGKALQHKHDSLSQG